MDTVSALETALGAELLRADLLAAPRPRIAGRYTVDRFLGRGATGLVIAARDERLARRVALKLSPALADETSVAEARALARLDHPNVVRIFDAGATDVVLDATPFRLWVVAMQLVDGVTMRTWLREAKRAPDEIVRVLRDAGAGLAAAHAERIVHRDFKPENVLVRTDGVAQVIDFGFAVPHRSSVGVTLVDVAGTAPYLAPEARHGHATPRSDQFAFGITLVEALTGDTTPPGRVLPEGVSPDLWRVARRASHPRPEKRYPDMAALLADLGTVQTTPRRTSMATMFGMVVLLLVIGWRQGRPAYLNHRCDPLAGTWNFRTRVDEASDAAPPVGTEGIYTLTLTHRGECRFDVRVEQTGDDGPRGRHTYRRQTLSDPSSPIPAQTSPLSPVRLGIARQGVTRAGQPFQVTYQLAFPDDRTLEGAFEATDYRGQIPRVSRFDPLAGHDVRRSQ